MERQLLATDDKSGGLGNPFAYLSNPGKAIVHGADLSEEAGLAKEANLLPSRNAVRICPKIVLAAIGQYQRRQL